MGPKERSGGSVVKRVMRGNCSKERRVILSISKACCGASGAKSSDRRYENVRRKLKIRENLMIAWILLQKIRKISTVRFTSMNPGLFGEIILLIFPGSI